jgi:hypothetical protein
MNKYTELKRYIIVFVITLVIFGFTFWLSALFSNKKVDQLREIQERIAIDILSTETRYSLLEQTSCDHVLRAKEDEFGLSQELNNLAKRVKHMESQLDPFDEDLLFVKEYYSLLQIKDFLLMSELTDRCDHDLFTILYFHEGGCRECVRQSLVLDEIVEKYPGTRVYWFDLDTPNAAMNTLISLFDVTEGPTVVVDREVTQGFVGFSEIEALLPEILKEFQIGEEIEESDQESEADTEEESSKEKNT